MSERDDSQSVPVVSPNERMKAAWDEIGQPLVDYLLPRLGSLDEAREAAQETYVRLLAAQDPEAILNVTSYAFKIAKNLATDLLKKRSRHSRLNEEFASEEQLRIDMEEHSSPDQLRREQIKRDEIERALQELPIAVRVVAEAVLDGETPKAIAARCGMNLRLVYRHIARADEHFRQRRSAARRGGRDNE